MPKSVKILQASAGSGKTYSLTLHYLMLLFSGENKYREILAVTFTNKATEEMKSRILEVLEGLARNHEGLDDIRRALLEAHPKHTPGSLQLEADKIYRKILHDYSRFSVRTIDGFVQRVIRGFAFELGLDTGYMLEMNYDKVKEQLAEQLDRQLDEQPGLLRWIISLALDRITNNKSWNYRTELKDLAGEIFKERYQPFDAAMQELSVQDGIDTLFENYQQLTRQSIAVFEEEIGALAASAHELFQTANIFPELLKGKSRSPLLLLQKIAGGEFEKIEKLGKLIDTPAEWFKTGYEDPVFIPLNSAITKLYQQYAAGLPDYLVARAVEENLYFLRLMQEMSQLLKAYREESGNLLISDAQRLLEGITGGDQGNPSFIWEKTGSRYKHFLFDEFQDTSVSQWSSFRPLLANALAESQGERTEHLIVGDVKQSIYRWRNGDWNILHRQARNDIGTGYIDEENLEANYRSAENIVLFNNHIYRHGPELLQRRLNELIADEAAADVQSWWREQDYDTIIESVYAQAAQQTHAGTAAGGTVRLQVIDEDEEGQALRSEAFRRLSMAKAKLEIRALLSEQGYQAGDICLLVRSNSEALHAVQSLMEDDIPVISGEALLVASNLAVRLLVNTLEMLGGAAKNTQLHRANCVSLYAMLNGSVAPAESFLKLGAKDIEKLSGILPAALCKNYKKWLSLPLPELIEKLIMAYELHLPRHAVHLAYMLAFRDMAGNFARRGDKGLHAFLDWWDEEGRDTALPASQQSDAVQVITIHKSKGLAFRAVLIPFCSWDLNGLPNSIFWVPSKNTHYQHLQSLPLKYKKALSRSGLAASYFEELLYNNMDALNMLYVATTRAKDYLSLTLMGRKKEAAGLANTSDLLQQTLGLYPVFSIERAENGSFHLEAYPPVRPSKPSRNQALSLDRYPVSERLSALFDKENLRSDLFIGPDSGREGSVLHEALSRTGHGETPADVLAEMLLEGLIKAAELPGFVARVEEVLAHPELSALLGQGHEVLNEQTIIAPGGRSKRPDKVLIKGSEVIIIDYKFTQEEQHKHTRQVQEYRQLLLQMGYGKVDAYLFYAVSGTLKMI
ncbi:DNA helicase UvrD [Pedobacter yulinensis]|uniref:DNA 3'-5' helicase n=1 Tax=Pedobacter yulinensis TaxID=2126353 RepID=A0A2T3HR37_9SPHI|nr:UvrD-helicase domain-containing protein [Pedobacter yulinensis]PST84908.1 DNA helicase UvrD [Pedobacter yulinensis]